MERRLIDLTNGNAVDYWDDDPDSEDLFHKTLPSAVEAYVEQECGVPPQSRLTREFITRECTDERFLECLRVLPSRSFFAFRRTTVEEPLIQSIARDLAERTMEDGLEELLDPNGLRPSDKALQQRLEVAFGAALREQLVNGQWRPWHCEQVVQVTLTAMQMEEMLRQCNPHWF